MSVGQLCTRIVATATPKECVRVAAHRMSVNDVGTLVVVDGVDAQYPVGFVTDRDIALRCVAGDLDPDVATVADIMSRPIDTIDESASIEDAMTRMATYGRRRIIVTGEQGTLVGVLSLDDVLEHLTRELQPVHQLLDKQQPRFPSQVDV